MSPESLPNITLLLGGTGKVSSRLARLLSSTGHPCILASRSGNVPSSLAHCHGVQFNWLDAATYSAPFNAAASPISAIFLVAPMILDCLPPMTVFIDLAIKNGVKRFVLLCGSISDAGDGPVMALVCQYLFSLDVEYAILKSSWFMENFSEGGHRFTIRDEDKIISAAGDGKVPFVSADDVAAVAYRALIDIVPHNRDYLILGPELLSYDDVATLLSRYIGRRITHKRVTEGEFASIMKEFLPADFAEVLAELDIAVKHGKEERLNNVVLDITGSKPKKFWEFLSRGAKEGVWERAHKLL